METPHYGKLYVINICDLKGILYKEIYNLTTEIADAAHKKLRCINFGTHENEYIPYFNLTFRRLDTKAIVYSFGQFITYEKYKDFPLLLIFYNTNHSIPNVFYQLIRTLRKYYTIEYIIKGQEGNDYTFENFIKFLKTHPLTDFFSNDIDLITYMFTIREIDPFHKIDDEEGFEGLNLSNDINLVEKKDCIDLTQIKSLENIEWDLDMNEDLDSQFKKPKSTESLLIKKKRLAKKEIDDYSLSE